MPISTTYLARLYSDDFKRREEQLKQDYERKLIIALAKQNRKYIPVQVKISALIITLINTTLFFYNFTGFSDTAIFWGTLIFAILGTANITLQHPFADKYKMHVRKFGKTFIPKKSLLVIQRIMHNRKVERDWRELTRPNQ